jgi:hypothetical protein
MGEDYENTHGSVDAEETKNVNELEEARRNAEKFLKGLAERIRTKTVTESDKELVKRMSPEEVFALQEWLRAMANKPEDPKE